MAKYKHSENFIKKEELTQFFGKDPKLLAELKASIDKPISPPSTKELTRHGGPLSWVSNALDQYVGHYNPDEISISTYNKIRMNAQVAAGLKVIKLPIIGQQWTTVSDDKDIAEFIDQLLRPIWYNLLTSILTAVDYGFSANEIVYDIKDITLNRKYEQKPFFNGKAVVWKKFKSLYPDSVIIKLDDMENFDGIIQRWWGHNVLVPVEKSFIFTHDKGDSFGNLFGVSRLKPAYDVWFWWINLVSFMMRYFERKGTPPVVVKFPLGQTKDGTDHADIALEIGKALIGESVVAIPSTTYENTPPKWDLNYLLDDKRGEMFLSALTFFENKILRAMFVPERTITQDSSSKAGSYSLSQVHADMFLLGEEALLVDIENQLNKYVVRRLIEYNFGPKAPQCYLKIERITDARKGFLKEVFFQMVKNGNAIPAAREIADIVGVPLEDENTTPNTDPNINPNDNSITQDPTTSPKSGDTGNPNIDSAANINIKTTPGTNQPLPGQMNTSSANTKKVKKSNTKQFEDNMNYWRLPNQFEDPKMLSDIQTKMDSIEKTIIDTLVTDVWAKQRDMIINKITIMLSDKSSIEDLWYQKIVDKNDTESIVLWRPLNTKMLDIIYSFMKDSYLFGQKTAIDELNLSDSAVMDKETISFIKNRSRMIVDNYFNTIKYKTELIFLSGSSENKTEQDLLNDFKNQFDSLKDRDLSNIVSTEGMLLLNRGRAKIAKGHS